MATKKAIKKEEGFSITYKKGNDGKIKDVKLKCYPLTMKNLLNVCEKLLAMYCKNVNSVLEAEAGCDIMIEKYKEYQRDYEVLFERYKQLKQEISQTNVYVLKHETELFHKPFWKKFLGL